MQPEGQEDERARRRRITAEATQPFFVPGYEGHWVGVVLFCATLVGATMLWSCLPTMLALLRGDGPDQGTSATFLALYAAMAVGPAAGWILWGARRRWMAMAAMAIFAVCVAMLTPAIAQ